MPLAHTFNYRQVVPALGFIPELDALTAPAVLVVYGAQSPVRPPFMPRHPPTTAPDWSPVPPTLVPGTTDICIAVEGVATPFVFTDVVVPAIHPELANADRQPPVAGEGRVVAQLAGSAQNIAWDAVRGLVWYVDLQSGHGTINAFNPSTAAIRSWNLPSSPSLTGRPNTSASQNVAVDANGGVWFDATGYNLYRFDPATGQFRTLKLALKTGNWLHIGSFVTAIVPYGSGVLVARQGTAGLTRYDSTMRVVGTVPLPPAFVGPGIVARAGSNLVIWGTRDYRMFDIHGKLLRKLPFGWSSGSIDGPQRAYSDDLRRAAIWTGGGQLMLLDANGRAIGTVPVSLDNPMVVLDFNSGRGPLSPNAVTTDWHGRWWYTFDRYVVEVDGP